MVCYDCHASDRRSQELHRIRALRHVVALVLLLQLCVGQSIPDLPRGVTQANVVVLGATLVLAGGSTACGATLQATADTLTLNMNDPVADWEQRGPLSQPIFGASYMAVGGAGPSAFVSYAASNLGNVSGKFYVFDAAHGSWRKCAAELNTPRRGAAFVATRTHLFVVGGVDEEQNSVANYEYCTASCDCAGWTLVEPPDLVRVKKQSGVRPDGLKCRLPDPWISIPQTR